MYLIDHYRGLEILGKRSQLSSFVESLSMITYCVIIKHQHGQKDVTMLHKQHDRWRFHLFL